MTEKKSLLHNFITFGLSSATLVFLFILAVVAARYLGPEDFGIFSFALAFVFFFDFILDPGLYHLMIREIARNKSQARRYIVHAFAWKLIAIPFALLLMVFVINILHESPRIHNTVYIIGAASFLKSAKDVYRSALLAYEKYEIEAISAVIEKAGLLLVGSLVLALGYGLYGLCWSFVVVRIIDLLVLRLMSKDVFRELPAKFELRTLSDLLRMGIPIGAYYVTLNIYNYIDTVMISVIRDSTEVGWYSASYKVYEGLLVLPVIMGTVYLPRMALLNTGDFKGFSGLVRQGWKFSLLLALLVTAAGVPLASDFISIFFGVSYSKSVLVMQILLFGAAFAYMVNFLQTVMISTNNQNTLFFIAMGGLVLNVVLNYFLIHLYGFVGAAVVTVFVEGVVFAALGRQVYIRIEGKKHISVLIKALLCWVFLGVFVFMAMRDMSAYVQSAVWSTGCVVVWRLLKIVDDDEWDRGVALVTRRLSQEMRNE